MPALTCAARFLSLLLRSLAAVLSCLVGVLASPRAEASPTGTSLWNTYNAGVQAYAAGDYLRAEALWQELSLQALPRGLRHPVWFQIANAQFRLGERRATEAPEEAVELWRRSAEAGRTALAVKPRDVATRHNLALIERQLAELLHRLGIESFQAADGKPRDEGLARLRLAVEQLDEAVSLVPADATIRGDRDRVRRALREALLARAGEDERRGDEDAKQASAWSDRQAGERYRDALEDLADAARPAASHEPTLTPALSHPMGEGASATAGAGAGDLQRSLVTADDGQAKEDSQAEAENSVPSTDPLDRAVAESRERVSRKLADLLARMGQREQKEGMAAREWGPDEALDHFESALGLFQEAQAEQPGHEAAERGEREVRKAMEQLHVREGQQSLEQGRERLGRRDPEAASSLGTALDHFEAALALNANNVPARNGAEEARRLLPGALVLAGQAAQQAGDRAEPRNTAEALAEYREAETDFQQALDLEPGQPQAQQGLEEVGPKLARMRERLAQEAQNSPPANRRTPTLEGLLDQVNERDPPPETERQRQRARNRPGDRRNAQDW